MTEYFNPTAPTIDEAKAYMGTMLQSFWRKEQGLHIYRKEILGTLVLLAVGGYLIYLSLSGMEGRSVEYYSRERLRDLFRWIFRIMLIIYRGLHLKKILSTRGELFTKGFYLKNGSHTYAYAFADITHLQKVFIKGSNHTIHTVMLTLMLASWETININGSGNEVMIQFSDTLSQAYAQSKQQNVIEQFKKGEKIWFWILEIDTTALYFKDQQFLWSEISEIKKARADRYLLVIDQHGKKLAKLDQNHILDEDLFLSLLSSQQRLWIPLK